MTVEQLFEMIGRLFVENKLLRDEIANLQKEITNLKSSNNSDKSKESKQ